MRPTSYGMNFVPIFLLVLFALPLSVFAQVVITEIMYSPAGADGGREWIEVKNTSDSSVDAGKWKLFESETNHYIRAVEEDGNTTLPAGGFAVIADNPASFLTDWPGFAGLLLDSAFSLSNTGETIILRDSELIDEDTASYSAAWGADGDGNSLQFVGGTWTSASPTPGKENSIGEIITPPSETGSQNTSAGTNYTQPPQAPFLFTVRISEKEKFTVVGAPARFSAETVGTNEGLSSKIRFIWNFGDGGTSEGQSIFHTYKYPGEYVVVLNAVSGTHAMEDRATIKAVPAELSISKIGMADDFFIELSNNSAYELNLSGWLLKSGAMYFVIPEHTFILPKKKLIFSQEATGLAPSFGSAVSLVYPNGILAHTLIEEVTPWLVPHPPLQKESEKSAPAPSQWKESTSVPSRAEEEMGAQSPETSQDNLVTKTLLATPARAARSSPPRVVWLAGVFALVLLGGAGVMVMRRDKTPAREFTITDENDTV